MENQDYATLSVLSRLRINLKVLNIFKKTKKDTEQVTRCAALVEKFIELLETDKIINKNFIPSFENNVTLAVAALHVGDIDEWNALTARIDHFYKMTTEEQPEYCKTYPGAGLGLTQPFMINDSRNPLLH